MSKSLPLVLHTMPELSDQGAAQCLDFLQELSMQFESYYGYQIRRHYRRSQADHARATGAVQ